jgi:Flp pilus assembly protein TadD
MHRCDLGPAPSLARRDDIDPLLTRARRARAKGDKRRALVSLREACMRNEDAAALWTLYGAWLFECGRTEEALRSLTHALWLRRRQGDRARVKTTVRVIERMGGVARAA